MPIAAVLEAVNRIVLRERARAPLASFEARVRVLAAGLCGTDLAIWSGRYRVPLPLVLGHEWCGEVLDVGRREDQAWVGQRVVAEINNHCVARAATERCALCAAGLVNHCLTRTVTGIVRHDGAFADEIVVPTGNLRAIGADLAASEAVLIEPLAAALQTFHLAPIVRGDLVVVLGGGRLGVLIALVAQRQGGNVLVLTRSRRRAPLFAALGLEHAVCDATQRSAPADPLAPAGSAILELVLRRTGARGADLVVEATGNEASLALALDLVRPRGTICLKSTPGAPVRSLDVTRLVVNEVRVQGSRCGSFRAALDFQAQHALPLARLIDQTFPLDEIERALAAAPAAGKVTLSMAADPHAGSPSSRAAST